MRNFLIVVLLGVSVLSFTSCGKKEAGAPGAEKARAAYLDINKRIPQGDISVVDEYMDPNGVGHSAMGGYQGAEAAKKYIQEYVKGFSDINIDVRSTAISGDTLFGFYHMTAKNTGDMQGMPATGKTIDVWGVDVIRFNAEGKLVEHWDFTDYVTMMKQLGMMPDESAVTPPPADTSKQMMEKK